VAAAGQSCCVPRPLVVVRCWCGVDRVVVWLRQSEKQMLSSRSIAGRLSIDEAARKVADAICRVVADSPAPRGVEDVETAFPWISIGLPG